MKKNQKILIGLAVVGLGIWLWRKKKAETTSAIKDTLPNDVIARTDEGLMETKPMIINNRIPPSAIG